MGAHRRRITAAVAAFAVLGSLLAATSPAAADDPANVSAPVYWINGYNTPNPTKAGQIGTVTISPGGWQAGDTVHVSLDYTLPITECTQPNGTVRTAGGGTFQFFWPAGDVDTTWSGFSWPQPPTGSTYGYQHENGNVYFNNLGGPMPPGSYAANVVAPTSMREGTRPRVMVSTMEIAPGRACPTYYNTVTYAEWPQVESSLDLDLDVYDDDGQSVANTIAPGQYVRAEVALTNETDAPLDGFEFDGGAPLVVDGRGSGEVMITATHPPVVNGDARPGLTPAELVLDPGDTAVFAYDLTATKRGIEAVHSRVDAHASDDASVTEEAHGSLKFDIERGEVVDEALSRVVAMYVMETYVTAVRDQIVTALATQSKKLKADLLKLLPPKIARKWFGADGRSVLDHAIAERTGAPVGEVDVRLPDEPVRGYSAEELQAEYEAAFFEKAGEGVSDWVEGWKSLGKQSKRAAEAAWRDSVLTAKWLTNNATPEQRLEMWASFVAFADNNDTSAKNIINTVAREAPRWQENGVYFAEALDMSVDDVMLRSPDIRAQLAQDSKARKNLLKLADKDPVAFQRKWAERDAEIANQVMPLILDTLVGGGASRIGGGAANLVVGKLKGAGRAVGNAGRATGALDAGGAATGATTIAAGGTEVGGAAARTTKDFLENLDGATVVRASDVGDVYDLPNLGGVPEITLDAKAGILGELETEYRAARGADLELAEVLKPSTSLRKEGGVAKLELTEQKTVKSAALDAGAPPDALGEAAVWRSTTHPSELPGWQHLDAARRQAAVAEWQRANDAWDAWQHPAPGSKTERLQQCIGQTCTVPLDAAPNAQGVQRFVTAEYEVVEVTHGAAEAKLIRVKKYAVEARNDGVATNTRTVVDSEIALPQTADADAVAVAKVVGRNADGTPKLAPLSRAEREFVMQRYIDKNIKARKSGAIPDAAEHGATLIMDDASAAAAGTLLPKYGVPFLPQGAGQDYLARIARHVIPRGSAITEQQMLERMLRIVQSEGGFGQHAVVVTRDSRYLGALDVASW